MFCPKCGKEEQQANSYCRSCGVWLVDPDKPFSFLKVTGEGKIIGIIITNLLCLIAAVYIAVVLLGDYDGRPKFTAALFALSIALWQLSVVSYAVSIRKHLRGNRRNQKAVQELDYAAPAALPTADAVRIIRQPNSVTENSTELLEPILRRSQSKSNTKKQL